jgi:hypothetical protein
MGLTLSDVYTPYFLKLLVSSAFQTLCSIQNIPLFLEHLHSKLTCLSPDDDDDHIDEVRQRL